MRRIGNERNRNEAVVAIRADAVAGHVAAAFAAAAADPACDLRSFANTASAVPACVQNSPKHPTELALLLSTFPGAFIMFRNNYDSDAVSLRFQQIIVTRFNVSPRSHSLPKAEYFRLNMPKRRSNKVAS